jgi:hypothetical protein
MANGIEDTDGVGVVSLQERAGARAPHHQAFQLKAGREQALHQGAAENSLPDHLVHTPTGRKIFRDRALAGETKVSEFRLSEEALRDRCDRAPQVRLRHHCRHSSREPDLHLFAAPKRASPSAAVFASFST